MAPAQSILRRASFTSLIRASLTFDRCFGSFEGGQNRSSFQLMPSHAFLAPVPWVSLFLVSPPLFLSLKFSPCPIISPSTCESFADPEPLYPCLYFSVTLFLAFHHLSLFLNLSVSVYLSDSVSRLSSHHWSSSVWVDVVFMLRLLLFKN